MAEHRWPLSHAEWRIAEALAVGLLLVRKRRGWKPQVSSKAVSALITAGFVEIVENDGERRAAITRRGRIAINRENRRLAKQWCSASVLHLSKDSKP